MRKKQRRVFRASDKLLAGLRDTPLRMYQVAALCGMSPSTVSHLKTGRMKMREFDARAFRIAKIVGVSPLEAIEEVPDTEVVDR